MTTTVFIADDHLIVRQGLRVLLEAEHFMVVGEASNGREAADLASALAPDVIVLDVGMPVMSGIEAARALRKTSPRARSILLTRHADDHHVRAALRAGVRGYVLKSQSARDLVRAIREVCQGHRYIGPGVSQAAAERFLAGTEAVDGRLTNRERQVLQLIGDEKTTKEIARTLGISLKTAESHRTRLMQKIDIHTTAGLVRYGIRHGLIEP